MKRKNNNNKPGLKFMDEELSDWIDDQISKQRLAMSLEGDSWSKPRQFYCILEGYSTLEDAILIGLIVGMNTQEVKEQLEKWVTSGALTMPKVGHYIKSYWIRHDPITNEPLELTEWR